MSMLPFSKQLLSEMIEQGYVQVQSHSDLDLTIYNYSQLAQFEGVWNEVTLHCRGLILNSKGEVVARPFKKFFNMGERPEIPVPTESFEVFEKMDGSLGIIFHYEGQFHVATRGSFTSDQSSKATSMLRNQYANVLSKLNPEFTYLVEIIYPENRIVVNYGEEEKLVLIGKVEKATGIEFPLEELGFPVVPIYHGIQDLSTIKQIQEDNKEGFVIRFQNGYRLKVKFEEYVRLHRLVTQVSSYTIWEFMQQNHSFEDMLERVPDEFYKWVKRTIERLHGAYLQIEDTAKLEYKNFESRKEAALYFQTCTYPAILFRMLDKRPYDDIIWKMIKPEYERPFADNDLS